MNNINIWLFFFSYSFESILGHSNYKKGQTKFVYVKLII